MIAALLRAAAPHTRASPTAERLSATPARALSFTPARYGRCVAAQLPPPSAPAALLGMTPYLLDQIGRAARRDLQARVKNDLGLSLRELWVIAVAAEGETEAKMVAQRLGLDRDTVADLVRALAERKLVERIGKHGVGPTKAGGRALHRANLAAQTVTTSVLGALEPEDRRRLHDLVAVAYASLVHED